MSEGRRYVITRFDVSYDYLTKTFDDAARLKDFVDQHLTMPWHGRRRYSHFETTTYHAEEKKGRNIVTYVKDLNGPRLRIECRFDRAASCRRYGGTEGTNALALLRVDPYQLMRRSFRFSKFDRARFDRLLDRRVRELIRRHGYRRAPTRRWLETIIGRACQFGLNGEFGFAEMSVMPVQQIVDMGPPALTRAIIHVAPDP